LGRIDYDLRDCNAVYRMLADPRPDALIHLAALIAEACASDGGISWDSTAPNGPPRRRLDTSRASDRFGFTAATGLREGVQRTIEWCTETSP